MSPDAPRIRRAASLSLGYNILQTLVKFAAAGLTGSVAILIEAFHSATDLLASGISFVAVRFSVDPPDAEHPYGHGKIDSLAGFAEAVLILVFSLYVGVTSVVRLFQPMPLVQGGLGAWLVGLTAVGAFLASRYVGAQARLTGSATLRSNAQHLRVDALTSSGVLVGVLVAARGDLPWMDPLVALVLAGVLFREGANLARRAFGEVIDERIEPAELAKIERIVAAEPEVLGHHKVRTRHSGPTHDVDLHIVLPDAMTVAEGHAIAHRIEQAVERDLAPATCVVHVDPASDADHED